MISIILEKALTKQTEIMPTDNFSKYFWSVYATHWLLWLPEVDQNTLYYR